MYSSTTLHHDLSCAASIKPLDCALVLLLLSMPVQSEGIWGSGPITQETFSDCANLCTFDEACQFMQFDYQSTENNCRLKVQPSATGTTT